MYVERTAECSFVLHGVPWSVYDELDRARGESSYPRLIYLDGNLELVMPGDDHEFWKRMLARFLETYAEETGVAELNGLGSATRRDASKHVGLEPDEWFFFKSFEEPEIAIEISASRSGVNKLEAYRRLGVNEVWLWEKKQIHIYRLVRGEYRRRERSHYFPDLDLEDLARRVVATELTKQMQTIRAYRKSLQRKR